MSPEKVVDLQDWVGRTREVEDIVTPRLVESLRATLAPHAAKPGDAAAPLGLHWCLAPDIADAGELGPDGHPAKGGFLPPVPLPRRMWAASDVTFKGSIALGQRRHSTIRKIEEKQGRTGSLFFVTVHHTFSAAGSPIIEEDQTIVYREAADAGGGSKAAAPAFAVLPPAPHQQAVDVDAVLLFRYSALTFNGHRIHYDAPYATEVEHYRGPVIHGPLQATLLLNYAAAIAGRAPERFSFRGISPATGPQRLHLRATPQPDSSLALDVADADNQITMRASAQW